MDATETWRPVPGFETAYEVSDLGRVRSLCRYIPRAGTQRRKAHYKTVPAKTLKPGKSGNGYLTVCLGKGYSVPVHTLVIEAFIGPRPRGHECRHRDTDKCNNRLSNLVYMPFGVPLDSFAAAAGWIMKDV